MDRCPELLGGRQAVRIGIDVVDLEAECCRERRRVQPDRQAADDEDAAIGLIELRQLRAVRPNRAPAVGNVVRQ